MITDTSYYDKRRGKIVSATGGAKLGKDVMVHGVDLLNDFMQNHSYFEYLVFAITGEKPNPSFAKWMESAFLCTSWPDPRIWCNRVAAYLGDAHGSPAAAVAASALAQDSEMYGGRTALESVKFLLEAQQERKNGSTIAEVVDTRVAKTRGQFLIKGYARPMVKYDERVVALREYARKLGIEEGPHVTLAFEIEDYILEKYEERINIAGLISAVCCDHGYTPRQVHWWFSLCTVSGALACYADACDRPENSFMPMRVDDVEYHGA